MRPLAYMILACAIFWAVLIWIAPEVAAAIIVAGVIGLMLALAYPRRVDADDR